jgi:exodeoxyribonuclease VII large subunit
MDFFTFHEKVTKPPEKPGTGRPKDENVLTVSQLTARIDKAFRDALSGVVHVKGELSNYKLHGTSGHHYFTLKDAGACLDCVMYKSDAARLKFRADDGIEVLASGRLGVYGQRGKYQLYVTRLEPVGQGALELALRQLCAKLEAEGLFEPGRKKPLPLYPQRIALVTSTQTAAMQDMLKVLRRFAWLDVLVYHVPVQGDGSAERIAAAIWELNKNGDDLGGVDVILLSRGGGSLEDLWEFNEEIVARAIVASHIPVITGIGHEVDVSVADLVADHHAHTPTEAAQVATTNWRNAREVVEAVDARLRREVRTLLQHARQRLASVERHEAFRRPLDRINSLRQLLDDRERQMALAVSHRLRRIQGQLHALTQKLEQYRPAMVLMRLRDRLLTGQQNLVRAAGTMLRKNHDRVGRLAIRLGELHPGHRIALARQRVANLTMRLSRDVHEQHRGRTARVAAMKELLNAVGPEQVLRRGYTITALKKSGVVVKSSEQLKPGEKIVTRFADGKVESVVEDSRQMKLFE